ncbi:MAG TPA: transcriptional repressor LexA [Firmicutes bacterium]|nr:transcriptional repressor LexA [Bacillota bacterium]
MRDITKRQRQILDYIIWSISEKGYPPSVREIGQGVGLASSSTVHGHLNKLEDKGYIRRDPSKPRAIELLHNKILNRQIINVPVVGKVTAGTPILAVENLEGHFPIAADLLPDQNVFMLRIQGESMINAGIYDGDFVFVRQQSHASDGDIVVALIEDEATVKRFYKENGYIRLQPENELMSPILVEDPVILGKVVGLFRRIP